MSTSVVNVNLTKNVKTTNGLVKLLMPFWNIETGSHAFDEVLFTNTTGFFEAL